jgi:hypothetical protein
MLETHAEIYLIMLKIITVLKSGPEWLPEYVYKFKKNLDGHITVPYEFLCLSDIELDIPTLPLTDFGQGYWNKIQLFRPEFNLNKECLYFDLDTIFSGNIDLIIKNIKKHNFLMLQDPWKPEQSGSGIMWWNEDYSKLWEEYKTKDPSQWSKQYNKHPRYGDQGYIIDRVNHCQLQSIIDDPNWITRFTNKAAKPDSKIIVFAGPRRKPWLNTDHPDVIKHWI